MGGFLTEKNFKLAYYRLYTAPRDYYKDFYFDDLKNFGMDLENNVQVLIEQIKGKVYKPYKASKVCLYKDSGLLRKATIINFIDLLVYQAILNVIAQKYYNDLSVFYNHFTFSNFLVEDLDTSIFFLRKWKNCWKAFRNKVKQYINDGYNCIGEFDIASFYDMIDHFLLISVLKNKDKDPEWLEMLDILESQLKEWACDSDRNDLKISHGIPQGPIGSGILAEIYLHYVDGKMKEVLDLENEFKYMRYVDDIRIFAKNKNTVEKWLQYVELLIYDLGLIPQYNKKEIKRINRDEIGKYIKNQVDELSIIDRNLREKGKLKAKQNKKLTKLVKQTIKQQEFDKTIIRFSLYRIHKDDQLKSMLMSNYNEILSCFDAVCYYLAKYYAEDNEVLKFVNTLLRKVPFDECIISTLLKYFHKYIGFDEPLFEMLTKNFNWHIVYFLIDWLECHNKLDLILLEEKEKYLSNIYLCKKVLSRKALLEKDDTVRKKRILKMMKSKVSIIALESLKLYYEFFGVKGIDNIRGNVMDLNQFVRVNIAENNIKTSYSLNFFEAEWGVKNARYLFDPNVIEEEALVNLDRLLFNAKKIENIDRSSWLSYINTFNHALVISLLKKAGIDAKNIKEYENCLKKENYFSNNFPFAYQNFIEINKRRNCLPSNHPYEDVGKYTRPLTEAEKEYYKNLEVEAIKEISNKCYNLYFLGREEVAFTLYDN